MFRLVPKSTPEIKRGVCVITPLPRKATFTLLSRRSGHSFQFRDEFGSSGYGYFQSLRPFERMGGEFLVARISRPRSVRPHFVLAMAKILAMPSRTMVVHPGLLEVDPQSLLGDSYGLVGYARDLKAHFIMVAGRSGGRNAETYINYPWVAQR